MYMDRVVPAIATVYDFPHFQRAVAGEPGVRRAVGQLRGSTDAARVHVVTDTTVGLDRPRCFVGAIGTAENELAMPRCLESGLNGRVVAIEGQGDHVFTRRFARFCRFEVGRVHAQVLAAVRLHQ
ncbi:hypothetical protein D3C77_265550 [compost metagenome]